MSQKETTTASIGHLDVNASTKDNLPKLAEQARQAYEQKRTKDCLDLTRAILLIDPDNTAALWMRSSIQSEMHRDLENARAFLREVQSRESTEAASDSTQAAVETSPANSETTQDEPSVPEELPSPAAPSSWKVILTARWLVPAAALLGLAITFAGLATFRIKPTGATASEPTPIVSKTSTPIPDTQPEGFVPLSFTTSAETAQPSPTPLVPPATAAPVTIGEAPPATPSPTKAAPAEPAAPLAATRANGTLAVSSPTSIDIYKDDTYIGSAPVSLELPAGIQMLEYRHGNLSKKLTHQINGNETTRAMITFDIDVQINSKPWAEVFLDGVERKALGQTPLSGVRVPIGSVLVFENPGFGKKKYRVIGNETGIQNVFP